MLQDVNSPTDNLTDTNDTDLAHYMLYFYEYMLNDTYCLYGHFDW